MKKINFILFCLISLSASSQFPAPRYFYRDVAYSGIGESGYSNCGILIGPDWCFEYKWDKPDLSAVSATLDYYTIYYKEYSNNNIIKLAETTDTYYNDKQGFEGEAWVTATYKDPFGESAPSNIIVSGGVPVSVTKNTILKYNITTNQNDRSVKITNIEEITSIKIYTIDGKLISEIFSLKNDIEIKLLNHSIYILRLTTSLGEIITKKVVL